MQLLQQATQCVHGLYDSRDHKHAANPPIYLTSTFEFDTAQACAAAFNGKPEQGQEHIYSRMSNPTNDILEKQLAMLEKAEAAVSVGSGMAAIASTLWTYIKANSVIVLSDRVYGATYSLFTKQFVKFGVSVEVVDFTNQDKVKSVCEKHGTIDVMFCESIQNPTNDLVDLEKLAIIAHDHRGKFIVDNTFATPLSCNPLTWGADIVVHSATKYLLGGVWIAGCIMGSSAEIKLIRQNGFNLCTGAVLDSFIAFQMIESLGTLHLRVNCMSQNATSLGRFLESHHKVEKVVATGLESHPQFGLAQKFLRISNGVLSCYINGGYDDCCAIMNKFRLAIRAVSLGKTHTLVSHPASMTHSSYSKEDQMKCGIAENLLKISVGCEAIEDIIADFQQALE